MSSMLHDAKFVMRLLCLLSSMDEANIEKEFGNCDANLTKKK